jgi:hypothetical protein
MDPKTHQLYAHDCDPKIDEIYPIRFLHLHVLSFLKLNLFSEIMTQICHVKHCLKDHLSGGVCGEEMANIVCYYHRNFYDYVVNDGYRYQV